MSPNRRHSNGRPQAPVPEAEVAAPPAEAAPPMEGEDLPVGVADSDGVAEALRASEDRFLRLAAEYDNYRKRTTREKAESFDRGGAAFAERLFGALDDLDRLLTAQVGDGSVDPFREGLTLIVTKLLKELEAGGLQVINPIGLPFNPAEHDAVALATPGDPALDDTVAATFQKGYRFRGNVIRPAKVQVYSVDGAI